MWFVIVACLLLITWTNRFVICPYRLSLFENLSQSFCNLSSFACLFFKTWTNRCVMCRHHLPLFENLNQWFCNLSPFACLFLITWTNCFVICHYCLSVIKNLLWNCCVAIVLFEWTPVDIWKEADTGSVRSLFVTCTRMDLVVPPFNISITSWNLNLTNTPSSFWKGIHLQLCDSISSMHALLGTF